MFLDFWWENKKGGRKVSKEGETNHPRSKLSWRSKEILIKKVFHLTYIRYWGNLGSIKKTREVITPIIDNVKLCDSQYSIERSQGKCKKWCRIGWKWRQYYGIELKEGTETLRTMFRITPECLMFYCFSLDFLFLLLWYFKVNCNVN